MELVYRDHDRYIFQLSADEKRLFAGVLQRYPSVPPNYQSVSRTGAEEDVQENQVLLEQELFQAQRENQQFIRTLLHGAAPQLTEHKNTYRLVLSPGETERLLQVLNDIRVGSWIKIGSPDNLYEAASNLPADRAQEVWWMEVSGAFQSTVLTALAGQ